jgi:hypothetical protein
MITRTLTTRLTSLERQRRSCSHPWHAAPNAVAVRPVDYRQAARPLMPGYRPPDVDPPPDRCPSCGAERPRVVVRAVQMPAGTSFGFGHRLTPHADDLPWPTGHSNA